MKAIMVMFGVFGGHVNVTGGRTVYMRLCGAENGPLYEYTLMPTHMRARFSPAELQSLDTKFTKNTKEET